MFAFNLYLKELSSAAEAEDTSSVGDTVPSKVMSRFGQIFWMWRW